ncbi:chloramphenicol-sensitive protein RarD [Aliiroseovarius halocynthiae]|uniref:EamA family transporter RarD n=1 Tax=Aliiroseovarius halocynthiae TaxID=985055 RepID=A0A545SX11_9RHOB|nr:EamA family transporter RarD [Aliiroseovarius halocynthiae]TQV69489.1 EamA family transporter RarD [Aliiroseovarius halocynthiae]SMR72889.1 chloramphenicol-sensitive protein RarD [Aliiroseovarius halocynthiae]
MSDSRKAVLAVLLACTIWGLSPLYYKALAHIPPLELLSHRSVWSLVLFSALLLLQGRLREVPRLFRDPRTIGLVALAGLMISANWGGFIISIQIGKAVEASLGYYIFPLVAVLLGRLIFGEVLGRGKSIAVMVAALAVLLLTYGLGVPPWISLFLAATFAIYGAIKKSVNAGPVVSVTGEVLLISPLALFWLWGIHTQGWTGLFDRHLATFGRDLFDTLMLIGSGALTAGPLMLFSYASKQLPLATIGVIQYLNPSLQFLCAAFIFAEPITVWHSLALPLIWVALAIYSVSAIRQERALRKASIA